MSSLARELTTLRRMAISRAPRRVRSATFSYPRRSCEPVGCNAVSSAMPAPKSRGLAQAIALTEVVIAATPTSNNRGRIGMTARSLARHFATEMGMTWRQALRQELHAPRFARGVPASITETAFAVGYASRPPFNVAFLEFVGETPTSLPEAVRRAGNSIGAIQLGGEVGVGRVLYAVRCSFTPLRTYSGPVRRVQPERSRHALGRIWPTLSKHGGERQRVPGRYASHRRGYSAGQTSRHATLRTWMVARWLQFHRLTFFSGHQAVSR